MKSRYGIYPVGMAQKRVKTSPKLEESKFGLSDSDHQVGRIVAELAHFQFCDRERLADEVHNGVGERALCLMHLPASNGA